MSYLTERASYIKGLAEGLGFDESTKEGRLFNAMIELIQDFADEVSLLEDKVEELEEEIEYLEDFEEDEEDFDDEDGDLDYFEVQCEKCGNIIYIDEDILGSDDEIRCPKCGELIEIEFEDCDDCGCCDCDCSDDEI